ncbi:MAG: putative toxin-antitoxin system toxin component, PIN family [Candidatus Omnitrophota bacterium]
MKVVVDTNVIVSGLVNAFSPPGVIVRMIALGDLQLCYDIRILSEYKEVLLRPKFTFNKLDIDDFIKQIEACGIMVTGTPLGKSLPDPNDEISLEIALAGKAICLITGNLKHYPVKRCEDMLILSPTDFLDYYRNKK